MIVDNKYKMQFIKENFNQIQQRLQRKKSEAETHFANLLNKAKIPYWREKGNYKYGTRWCYYDFYLPTLRLYVEIDGKEHNLPKKKAVDREKFDIIKNKHCYLLRLKNEEVLILNNIDVETLVQLIVSKKKKRPIHYLNKMMKNIQANMEKSIQDMRDNANFTINEEQPIFVYDHKSGEYYEFENIFMAKIATKFTINEVHKLLEMEHKKSPQRRYVFGYSLLQCEARVATVFG